MSKLVQEAVQTRKRVRELAESTEAPIAARKTSTNKPQGKLSEVKASKLVAKSAKSGSKVMAKKNSSNKADRTSTVIYLGHIPHGFYEREISKFFGQFGEVKQVKLFRSQKTNGSKGYAFIKFAESDAASVSAEAMNGYFLNDRQLVCHVVAAEKLHKGMFAKPKRKESDDVKDNSDNEDAGRDSDEEAEEDPEKAAKRAKLNFKKQQKKMKKLAELGIDYDFLPSLCK